MRVEVSFPGSPVKVTKMVAVSFVTPFRAMAEAKFKAYYQRDCVLPQKRFNWTLTAAPVASHRTVHYKLWRRPKPDRVPMDLWPASESGSNVDRGCRS